MTSALDLMQWVVMETGGDDDDDEDDGGGDGVDGVVNGSTFRNGGEVEVDDQRGGGGRKKSGGSGGDDGGGDGSSGGGGGGGVGSKKGDATMATYPQQLQQRMWQRQQEIYAGVVTSQLQPLPATSNHHITTPAFHSIKMLEVGGWSG